MVALHGKAHVMSHIRTMLRFAFKAKWVAPWLGIWNARIPMLLVKPSQAPEMLVYEPWAAHICIISKASSCSPDSSWEPGTAKSWNQAVQWGQTWTHCAVSALQPNCDNFPIGFPTWLLVLNRRQRNHFSSSWCQQKSWRLNFRTMNGKVGRTEENSNIIWYIFLLT